MFRSPQFCEALSYFQQLLQEGTFDLSFSEANVEDCRTLKRLILLDLKRYRWVEYYEKLKVLTHKFYLLIYVLDSSGTSLGMTKYL